METTRKRQMNPNSLKNLRPIQKGQVLNPRGPPKKVDCLLECIKGELVKTSINSKLTNEQLIASMLVAQATRGNIKAIELMMSYLHAKLAQGLDLNAQGKLELVVKWDGNRSLPNSTFTTTSS